LKKIPFILGLIAFAPLSQAAEKISYSREILPILSENCFYCHGPDKEHREEDLRLDIRADAIKAFAWDPENPPESEALIRIFSDDKDEVMPPPESHRSLTAQQKELIKKWVEQGAEYETHWAFVTPPKEIPVPATADKSWAKTPIDSFILARLEKEKLAPSPAATPERWLRRVTFDLTGLPPTQAEIDAFLTDTAPTARETVVDRLLASPRFGERMAIPWLDVARYADSFGYQSDVDMLAWPYRDWVIKAFNENLPLDQFITQQLAGDLLPDATRDQQLATAFNRIHRKTNEGGSVPEEFRQDGISDRVHTVGTAFMALTMECARCHDHKYDPITAKDYYAMGAFFNSIGEFGLIGWKTGVLPQPALLLPTAEQEAQLAATEKGIADAEAAHSAHLAAAEPAFQAWLASAEKTFPDADLAARFPFDGEAAAALQNAINPAEAIGLGGNQLAAGKAGNGVLTNGDASISVPHYGIRNADQPFSVSLWLKPGEDYPEAVVFANSTSADAPYSGYELVLEKGKLRWTLAREFPGNAASIATAATIPTGEWTHVTVTCDGSRKAAGLKIFLNGQPAATTVAADTLTRDIVSGGGMGFAARSRFPGLRGGMIDEIQVHTRAITAAEVAAIHSRKPLAETTDPALLREYYLSAIDATARELSAKLSAARAAYRNAQNGIREIPVMRDTAEPVPAHILARGDYTQPTVKVERETPDWLPPFLADQPRNRLGFAKWLTSPDHPLTARVMVNRIWQEIFGTGIVETSDNFGLQGAQPSHPELLDWLARDLANHGWDHKRAIKQMVLSATYGQDSKASPELRERDPANTLHARGPARRLTAEQLRDSALALSGLLAETIGGPPVKPYQAPGSMWRELNSFLPEYQPDKGASLYRRSLYTFWRRTTTPPNMTLFDTATREVCATRRTVTNTPLQALVMLNDPQFVEAARKLGERILKEGGTTDETRAKWAYRHVTGTAHTSGQLPVLTELITQQRGFFASKSSDADALLKVGDSPADPALDKTELATFTALAQALLNLDANITLR
jgi:Protein of unknown function (DUF1553)/Protein of unknown function (DUF1549)/Concanavalin A-like lectin/glucanases superfamily/Planctomycete cytochrome C